MGLRLLGSTVAGIPADVMARIAAAESTAAEAKADALAADGRAEVARVEAVKAEATGQNARQMVLNRDVKIAEAQTVAVTAAAKADAVDVKRGEYEAALTASITDRAAIHGALDRLTARIGKPDAIGSRGIAALLLGAQTAPLTIQLSRTMPDLNYRVEMTHSAVVTLATGMLVETGRTTTTVTVRVTAVGLALAAGTLIVAAREA